MKKGISLIVLVITIIIIIILAGSVILSLADNNPIASASEAKLKSDIDAIKSELNLYVLKQYSDSIGNFDISNIKGKLSEVLPEIFNVTSFDADYEVLCGQLVYKGTDETVLTHVSELGVGVINGLVTVNGLTFNKPDISYLPEAAAKAIKWSTNIGGTETLISLSVADTDTSWYDYTAKKWANIKTSNNGNDAYWVWVPRYAYKINNPHTTVAEQINIKFLAGTSDILADGTVLPNDYIVHPAFTFGDKQLPGIWVAKYEASSSTPNAVDGSGYTGGGNTTLLQVRVLPSVYSWRNISTGNVQTVSMNMSSSQGSIGTTTNIDTHQIKNVEWGAVAYLSQSIYGQEPWINPYGDSTVGSYKLKTGYAGTVKNNGILTEGNVNLSQYNTINGVNASTTGNIYGVYDMSGGAWEYTAAVIDNGNGYIGSYGSIYVTNNKIKEEYTKYYDIYDPGEEAREGGILYGAEGTKLWNSTAPYNVSEIDNNIIRKRITDATYENYANKKGDGLYEVSNGTSYYGKYTSGTAGSHWLKDTIRDYSQGAQISIAWNGDYNLTGYACIPWFMRGGGFNSYASAGPFFAYAHYGSPSVDRSFRPVLVLGSTL
jgi:hypothetical protein